MLTKIYLILTAIFAAVMAFLGFYSWSWLQSIDKPQTVAANFDVWSGYYWIALWTTSLILLITANIILWNRRNSWALWTTLGYFVIFILLKFFWLNENYLQYRKTNNLTAEGISVAAVFDSLSAVIGILICVIAAAVVFFNQYLVLRMQERMFPIKELPAVPIEETGIVETNDEEVRES